MCTVVNTCGCHQAAPVGPMVIAGLLWRAAKLAARWLSGAPLRGHRTTDATFLHAAHPPGPVSWRHPRWACWPGWQRATVRWVLTALAVTAWLWPIATTAVVALAVVATAAAAVVTHRRRAHRRTQPVRVQALSTGQRPAVQAGPQLQVNLGQPHRGQVPR